jgi:ribosomal protein S18 acetylase RimI-like enzyme
MTDRPADALRLAVSTLDSDRFGVRIARARPGSPGDVRDMLAQAATLACSMVIARVDAGDVATIHALEAAGGRLCDTLVYFARDVVGGQRPAGVRLATIADAERIEAVAAAAFAGYVGHYHNDGRLDRAAADATYADWARRSVIDDGVADRVWVVEDDGVVAGFLVLRLNDAHESEIMLNAVDPKHQRRGLYARLIEAALAESSALGIRRCTVSTQLVNRPVQRVWVRLGFVPWAAGHTFHAWLR